MEDIIFQIYGTLVLTIAGFVLPVLTIAISVFPEGTKVLKQTYENQQKQAEKSLEEELQKQKKNNEIDYNVLTKNIKQLKSLRNKAKKNLSYLDPKKFLSKTTIIIGLCIGLLLTGILFYKINIFAAISISILSLLFLFWTIKIFSSAIGIIIEASNEVQNIRRTSEEKILELLTTLVDNSKQGDKSLFIEHSYIEVFFNNEKITSDKEYIFSSNKAHPIKIQLKNLSEYMLKTAELGFTFPSETLVEGSSIASTYTADEEKIIRFKYSHLQSNVNQIVGTVNISFLKTGVFNVNTFVKGENLKNKTTKFRIKVID